MVKYITANCGILLAFALLTLGGCGENDLTDPASEKFESLELTAPNTIVAGDSFSLVVQAVGSSGTRPMGSVNGEVSLSVSSGTITPGTATLVNGEVSTNITLSATEGVVQISANHAQVTGAMDLTIASLRELSGNDGDRAAGAIPDLEYVPAETDFSDTHPQMLGLPVSTSILLLNFTTDATVGQANPLIQATGGAIIGGIPGSSTGRGGMLMLRVPFGTHAEVDSMITALEAEAAVQYVGRDQLLTVDFVPDSGKGASNWVWERDPGQGNWGMEITRMPQMWNLNPAVGKSGDPTIATGVFDAGFGSHNDLSIEWIKGTRVHDHGMHVAGIIGAGFDNGHGVDGVTPFARLVVGSPQLSLSMGEILEGIEDLAEAGCRVINLSLGQPWSDHPDESPGRRTLVESYALRAIWTLDNLREAGTMPLLVCAAGNEGFMFDQRPVEARWGSAFNYAALDLGAEDIIVVEALAPGDGGIRAFLSNHGGHVSAPGLGILSTVDGGFFALKSGTSMATPHVTGLASFLLSIDSSLTNAELIQLMTSTTKPALDYQGVPSAGFIDGFAAALSIDGLRGTDDVVRMLLDIDDGTLDGNQRLTYDDPPDDYLEEDADGDGEIGDGIIDMSDFRRWRDWYHQLAQTPGAGFDGSAAHTKFDVNGNGRVDSTVEEHVYPRADFNGDGTLDLAAESVVPGNFPLPQTDFEVLARYFDDAGFPEETLEQLVLSGDIHVDLIGYLAGGRFDHVVSEARTASGDIIEFHEHTAAEPLHVYTLESDLTYDVFAWGISNGDTLCANNEVFEVGLCTDDYWVPECSSVVVEITLAQIIAPDTASPLLVRAGLTDPQGNVQYQSGLAIDVQVTGGSVTAANGFTDMDGFFSTEVVMGASSQQLNVLVTATDPLTSESSVALATAHPFQSNSVVTPVCESIGLSVQAGAQVGSLVCEQIQNFHSDEECNFTPFSETFSGSCSESDPECGVTINTTAEGAVQFLPEFHPTTGDLVAILVTGSVSASFSGNLDGNCGQTGNSAFAQATANMNFEVSGDPVSVRLAGSADFASSGYSRPRFLLTADGPFELLFPETGSSFDETWDYQPGYHTLTVSMRTLPEFQNGPSAGSFMVELRFIP